MTRLVVALTGTDHHPFDRMVEWIDEAALRHRDTDFVVQYGAARAPQLAAGYDYLAHDHLQELLEQATVVVCHGGPGTVTEARDAGHVPLCMPRDPRLGEHVDDHQQRFAALVGSVGVVHEIRSRTAFDAELDAALREGPAPAGTAQVSQLRDAARARAAVELDHVMSVSRPQIMRRRRA